jgi:hypothetical protein
MKQILMLVVLALILTGVSLFVPSEDYAPEKVLNATPTNFVKIGTIIFQLEGAQAAMYFTEDSAALTPGAPAGKKLIVDPLSACVTESGAVPCVAMNTSLDAAFSGKRILLDGIESETDILVRKIRALREGEMPLMYDPGNVYISWPQAVELIEKCAITEVVQTHSMDVHITLPDKSRLTTVEPRIDEVFTVLQKANCSNVVIATE